jgi:hypothetical protein
MHLSARSVLSSLFGGLIASAAMIAPAASAPETITLKVPVQMKEMLATAVKVECRIFGADGATLSKEFKTNESVFQMPNGEFDQVVEVVLTPQGSGGFALAKSYSCKILVIPENTYIGFQTPVVGTPASGTPIWKLARPDKFFRAQVTGQLEGTIGVGGPKGFQHVPQPPADPKTEQIVPKASLKQ